MSRERDVWYSMITRCTKPSYAGWHRYGGRGITVCARWLPSEGGSFENFLADVGERPMGKSLDRIDVDGHYEPGNVRWATAYEQAANKRQTDCAPSPFKSLTVEGF